MKYKLLIIYLHMIKLLDRDFAVVLIDLTYIHQG